MFVINCIGFVLYKLYSCLLSLLCCCRKSKEREFTRLLETEDDDLQFKIIWDSLCSGKGSLVKICSNKGFTTQEVVKYVNKTRMTTHQKNVTESLPIALFINGNNVLRNMYLYRRKEYTFA